MTLNITTCLFLLEKQGNINTSMSAAPKLALVPASHYYCDVHVTGHTTMYVPSFIKIERGSDGEP